MTRARILQRLAELNDKFSDATLFAQLTISERLRRNPANCQPFLPKRTPRSPLDAIGSRFPTFFVATPAGTIINISAAAARLLGGTAHDLIGRQLLDLVTEDEQSRVCERWMVAAQTKSDFAYTTKCIGLHGATVYLFIKLTAVYNSHEPDGKMFYVGTVEQQRLPLRVLFPVQASA